MTHVPYYPHTDPRQNWVHISSPIAAPDSLLPLYMLTSTSPVNTHTNVNSTHVNININVNTPNAPLNSNVPNVNNPANSSQPPTPAQIANLIYPRILHQHSLLTSVQNLLDPIHSSPTIPAPTLRTLHKLLHDKPHLLALLPPPPHNNTPAPPVPHPCPMLTQLTPNPSLHPATPPTPLVKLK